MNAVSVAAHPHAGERVVETEQRRPQAQELSESDLAQVVGGLAHPYWGDTTIVSPVSAEGSIVTKPDAV